MEYVRESLVGDVSKLAPVMRQADIDEVKAASGHSPEVALLMGMCHSRPAYTFLDPEGNVAGMFGVVPSTEISGAVWMLGGTSVERYPITFLKNCRKWTDHLNELYPVLFNVVDERNELHIKWLKWMGFSFINKHEAYGVEQRPFYEFVRVRTHV
jgi:hypothetical protein